MKTLRYIALAIFLSVPVIALSEQNTLTPQEKAEGFELLFDGKVLSPEIWQAEEIPGYPVKDGEIVCEKGGNLLTIKEYGDFIFRCEFLLPPGGNNGIGLRAESKKNPAYNGMEIQVLDDTATKWKNLKDWQYCGSIYGIVPAKRGHLKPVGEWNSYEITAKGTKITVKLNDVVILEADIAEFKDKPLPDDREHPGLFRERGHVGFLGHNDPVRFRNVRIKSLDDK